MKQIVIPASEYYNEKIDRFVKVKSYTIKLEHSLLSLYKWESKHHKYFIKNETLNSEEILDYIKCMTLNQVDDEAYNYLTDDNIKEIRDYIEDPMTATWFDDSGPKSSAKKSSASLENQIVTAEVIYSSMIILGIPIEIFEKRHLNHLLTLIRVCNEKQNPDENKVSEREMSDYYSRLNRERRKKLGTKG